MIITKFNIDLNFVDPKFSILDLRVRSCRPKSPINQVTNAHPTLKFFPFCHFLLFFLCSTITL